MVGIFRMSGLRFSMPTFQRRRGGWLVFLAIASAVAVACAGGEASVGPQAAVIGAQSAEADADVAPDFEIVLFENANHRAGETLRLSDLRGQPVVVNFWYPSCPPCRAEMPDLEQAFQDHREQGVEFIGVQELILDTVEDGQDFVDEIGISYAVGPDLEGELIAKYGISGFPTTVFIDRDQKIVRKWTGILNAEKIDELIAELLN